MVNSLTPDEKLVLSDLRRSFCRKLIDKSADISFCNDLGMDVSCVSRFIDNCHLTSITPSLFWKYIEKRRNKALTGLHKKGKIIVIGSTYRLKDT